MKTLMLLLCVVNITSSPTTWALDVAGNTIMARGVVKATNPEQQRQLARRLPIYQQDQINTEKQSSTQLRMLDGGLLSLQASSELVIEKYLLDKSKNKADIQLNLLTGGLRTVSGEIKSKESNYQLKTPIASIGIRGTHYEVELVNGDLLLAVWQGAIDIQVLVGSADQFSLGQGEDFRFAIVRANGEVEFLLTEPKVFEQGHSRALATGQLVATPTLTDFQLASLIEPSITTPEIESLFTGLVEDQTGNNLINNDQLWSGFTPTTPEIVASRVGQASFSELIFAQISSSAGTVTNFSMQLMIDFDLAQVPQGQLAFDDSQGSWFASFNGIINANALELNINFAAHGDELAQGTISALFTEQATQLLGQFELTEPDNPAQQASGSFVLGQTP